VITQRIRDNQGIPVITGEPIVVFREQPQEASREVEGQSPNRHNKFYLTVEPMAQEIVDAIQLGEVSMDMPELERREALQEAGMDKDTSQNVEDIHRTNILIDDTKGIQHLNETMELVLRSRAGYSRGPQRGPPLADRRRGPPAGADSGRSYRRSLGAHGRGVSPASSRLVSTRSSRISRTISSAISTASLAQFLSVRSYLLGNIPALYVRCR